MIGEQIKKLRKDLDLTQQEFCEKIGVKRNTIAKYETSRGEPTTSVISLIVREFNVSETWLRTGKGEMYVLKEADPLDELVKQRSLSDGDRLLIEKFLKLEKEERQAVIKFLASFADGFSNLSLLGVDQGENDIEAYGNKAKELAEKERISEKKPDAPALSAKESAVG